MNGAPLAPASLIGTTKAGEGGYHGAVASTASHAPVPNAARAVLPAQPRKAQRPMRRALKVERSTDEPAPPPEPPHRQTSPSAYGSW